MRKLFISVAAISLMSTSAIAEDGGWILIRMGDKDSYSQGNRTAVIHEQFFRSKSDCLRAAGYLDLTIAEHKVDGSAQCAWFPDQR
jgi:hypothetical protein